ncbi:phosphoadenylyl-sulfate reductase [Lapillicoccus jejuensis]|uniref:Adenosine 5'-phosphosulfate reductase n=1 Tax=Lapillicoccus jejuensis TaxID=402171 RepID=A0A542E4B1_9MICO|nr:phosphoadenylyl-sulfate reductase [Lapillicoccus jejuensis]TQJ10183.1 phosphoadenylylsulfate reductase (thioredoxin) [Lapillicoccus jejuensis]
MTVTVPRTGEATRAETLRDLVEEGSRVVGDLGPGREPATYEERVEMARRALRWAHETFGEALTVASSMGDTVMVHLAGTTIPGCDVFFLDTGYHFAETIGTRDAYDVMLPIRVRTVLPLLSVKQQDVEYGPRLHDRDPDLCCALRKVEPLQRALRGRQAWVSGLRRDESPSRADTPVVGWDAKREMVKLNPLATWTHDDVERFVAEEGVFENPLKHEGYASIGCGPCTRAIKPGEDERAGRWAGSAKTECGLHT